MTSAIAKPLRVAVVGHTNTGKTSLLRTLMRDVAFGEVSDHPATTRHVEGATLMVSLLSSTSAFADEAAPAPTPAVSSASPSQPDHALDAPVKPAFKSAKKSCAE